MTYNVKCGYLSKSRKERNTCRGERHWSDEEVSIVSHESWKKDAKFKFKRLRKSK